MITVVKEAVILLAISLILAFGVNFFSPHGIALTGVWYDNRGRIELEKPPSYDPAIDSVLTMEDAFDLWKSGQAIFIDARLPDEYAEGHLPGAINLPFERWDDYWDEVSPLLAPDAKIVIYCGGIDCELSVDVARELIYLGYKNAYIFFGGYSKWLDFGLPVEIADEK